MKVCPTCGAQLADNTKFCVNCGTKIDEPAPAQVAQPVQPAPVQYQQTQQSAGPQPNILVFGILSLVFGGIVGIILASIGRKKGKAYVAAGGTLTGASKVGFILCKVGLILSIISTVVLSIYFIVLIAGLSAGVSSGLFEQFSDLYDYAPFLKF